MNVSSSCKRQWGRWAAGLLLTGLLLPSSYIALRLAIARTVAPQPQAIFTLGGDRAREEFTATFALAHSELDVWISGGNSPEDIYASFAAAEVDPERLHLDYRATDTVTNFTTMVDPLARAGVDHVYLLTSEAHMPRAWAIATIVFGSRGITITEIAIPTSYQRVEIPLATWRDCARAALWLLTGRTGARFHRVDEAFHEAFHTVVDDLLNPAYP